MVATTQISAATLTGPAPADCSDRSSSPGVSVAGCFPASAAAPAIASSHSASNFRSPNVRRSFTTIVAPVSSRTVAGGAGPGPGGDRGGQLEVAGGVGDGPEHAHPGEVGTDRQGPPPDRVRVQPLGPVRIHPGQNL